MKDVVFIKVLKEINESHDLSKEYINNIIEKYESLEAISGDRHLRSYIGTLVTIKMADVSKRNLKKVLMLINEVYNKMFTNYRTLDSILSYVVRKPLALRFGTDSPEHIMSKNLVKIPYNEKGKLIQEDTDKLTDKNRHVTSVSVEEVTRVIRENIDSEDPYKQAIALLLCCGSRPNELLLRSTYVKGSKPYTVIQEYLSKRGPGSADATVEKPLVYLTPDEFITRSEILKNKFKEIHPVMISANDQMISSVSVRANKVMRELFPNDTVTFYCARKYYGVIAHAIYGSDSNYNQFLQDVFDHKDLNVSKAYSNFKIKSV